ncbi:RNA-directed DNA polymerase from mobile element jockey [Trichonephila clavipes]|nr:RNA-directed DNA polymerase from mobile element jockey [Trichonephila clavipes]
MRLIGAVALNTQTTRKEKNQNKNKNGPKPKNNQNKNIGKKPAPRPDISKARKVSPNLDYSKVVQNLIPQEQETWLELGIDPQIANYRLFKDDRIDIAHTQTRGGTAIYCKSEILHSRVPLPELQGMDATAVQIKIKNFPPLNIVLVYVKIRGSETGRTTDCHTPPTAPAERRYYRLGCVQGCGSPVVKWEKHIEALSPIDNTLWRKSSLLRKPFYPIPPLQGALGSIAVTPIEKAEVIADILQEQFEPNHVVGREEFAQRIHAEVENFLAIPHVQEIEPTTPTEVLTYVQRIKPRKSPGLDQITNRMLKNLPLKFLLFITLLINQLFKNNYFPDSWKTALVIPILKPDKNPETPQNYRLISLLSSLSKVYEFVLLRRLNQHCAASNIIIPQQCGFRRQCSTVHQLLRVTGLIHSGFEKHLATGILFLDIAKAFDKIWHEGLLFKLIRLDFPPPLIKSIHSFLSHRSFRVRVDRILSSPRPIRSGLPQGSLSSPLLFTLYVNDIPQTDLSHLAMFTNDTAIITQNKRFTVVISNLQRYISLLELWLNDWKIKVNASKSVCLMFTRRSQLPVGLPPVTIFGQPVPWLKTLTVASKYYLRAESRAFNVLSEAMFAVVGNREGDLFGFSFVADIASAFLSGHQMEARALANKIVESRALVLITIREVEVAANQGAATILRENIAITISDSGRSASLANAYRRAPSMSRETNPSSRRRGESCCRNFRLHKSRLFVKYRETGCQFLVDSGTDISILPWTETKGECQASQYKLYAANGTEIPTYGLKKILTLDLGLRRPFQWPFIIAKVKRGIIGADFLQKFQLLIDLHSRKLSME